MGKNALSSSSPPTQNRGGVGARRRRPIRPPWASTAARGRGERRWGPCGVDSRPHLVPGRRSEAGRRGPAAAALLKRGGGASAGEGRRWWPGRFECEGAAPVGRLL